MSRLHRRVMAPMPRSKLDTLIYATILLAPMAVATGYLAFAPPPIVTLETAEAPVCTPEPAAQEPAQVLVEPAPASAEPAQAPVPADPPPAPVLPAPGPGVGMLMYEGQLVLATAPDLTWSKGQLREQRQDWSVRVSKRVVADRLPEPLRALGDARMVVYAADGSACVASTRADDLNIHARQDGELFYPEEGEDEVSPKQRRAILEEVFAEAQLLRARLHREAGQRPCEGLWARPAALAAPAVFAAHALDRHAEAALRDLLLPQLAGMPRVKALGKAYREHATEIDDATVPWATYMRDTLQITRWDELGGTRSYVNVIVGDGGEPCTTMFYEQVALQFSFEAGVLTPLDDPGFIDPLAVMDLERDGHLEAVTQDGLQLESRGPAGAVQGFEIPYHGCPC